jgi:hypothetical protein
MAYKINKKLAVNTRLIYKGKPFDGFDPAEPGMTFLGYDSNSWSHIWTGYKGTNQYISIHDVEVDTHPQERDA